MKKLKKPLMAFGGVHTYHYSNVKKRLVLNIPNNYYNVKNANWHPIQAYKMFK